tara:strand:+ start:204 stop:1217 length:1014 start_codon:yes stop_codon:yes gene_type:complete
MKLLLKDVKADCAKVLSMSSTDSRVVDYINEAQERLLYKGKWPGTYIRYAVTQSNGAITWPRQLETIESVAVGGASGKVRDGWYEFLESGPGLRDKDDGDSLTLIDRGTAPCFSDIVTSDGVEKKIRVRIKSADNVTSKSIILQGYDENGDWIRTTSGGSVIDGEKVTFGSATDGDADGWYDVDTTSKFQTLSAVIKDTTDYPVKLLEIEATGSVTERLLSQYEPSETTPEYRRSLIPGLSDDNTTVTVTVVGKARFIPAANDNDWLYIDVRSAIKEMVISISMAEKNMLQEAVAFEQRAIGILQDYLMHYLGDGAIVVPRISGSAAETASGVQNIQ